MSSSNHQSPEHGSMTPEHSASAEHPPPGFTAVNGRSPSNASSGAAVDSSDHSPVRPAGPQRRESQTSGSKRKESNEPPSPLNEQHVLKKLRTVESQEHSVSMQPPSEILGPDASRDTAARQPDRNQSDSSWSIHERNGSITSEAHLAEVLQNNITAHQMAPADPSQDPRYHLEHAQHYHDSPSGAESPTGPTTPQLNKQRKRNFSNRTKTGCLTCRERKKKCDEGKPECTNCQRGGFYCKGYVQTNHTHFKNPIPRDQPHLQAKNGYYNHQYRYSLPAPPYYEAPQPDGRRAGPGEDGRDLSRTIPQPQEPTLRPGYAAQQWSEPAGPPQYAREGILRPDYQQVPPLRDLPHQQKQFANPPPAPIHPPHNRNMSQHAPKTNGQPAQQYHRGQEAAAPYTEQRLLAQSALDHQSSQQAYIDEHLSEKQKMLKGYAFNRSDPKLKQERYDCAQAIYRFNKNAIEPGNLSEASRRDQFRQILDRTNPDGSSPNTRKRRSMSPQSERVNGHFGVRVEVEAPFFCEYGYNIKIGDDTDIGPNCRIMDSCHVEIGPRCIIGPDVKILALDGDHNSYRPQEQKRACRAKRIVIGADVFIGAGAIILPGIKIHKGATIGAGCVVSRDVTGPVVVVPGTYPRYTKTHYGYGPQ